jgi:hypothetical protein
MKQAPWKSMLLIGGAALVLSACSQQAPGDLIIQNGGSPDTPGTPPDEDPPPVGKPQATAKDTFVAQIHPMLMAQPEGAACGMCHSGKSGTGVVNGPQFLTATAEGSYNLMEQRGDITVPASSVFYLHGNTAHTGPAFTEEMKAAVEAWLMQEAEERGLVEGSTGDPGMPTGKTLATALHEFGDCMSYEDWLANGLDLLQNMQVDGGERCRDCHSVGQNNTWLGPDAMMTFEMNRTFPFILRLVTGMVDEEGNFSDLTESKRFMKKGQEACISEPCHPDFQLDQELETGLTTFYAVTKVKYDQGPCLPDQGMGGAGGGGQ